jgi:hypothetical protein
LKRRRPPESPDVVLTSDEKRTRAATLILKARLGRPPTHDEIVAFEQAGGLAASVTPAFCDRRVAEAEKAGDARAVARWRSIGAGLARLSAHRQHQSGQAG